MKNTRADIAPQRTLDDLVRIGSIDAFGPVPAARERLATARRAEADAAAAFEQAQRDAAHEADARKRRAAKRSLDERRDAVLDATADRVQVGRDLVAARRIAFDVAAPVIRAAHVQLLPELERCLGEIAAVCGRLQQIERVAGAFQFDPGGSSAPSRSAIVGELGDPLITVVEHWRRVAKAHRLAG